MGGLYKQLTCNVTVVTLQRPSLLFVLSFVSEAQKRLQGAFVFLISPCSSCIFSLLGVVVRILSSASCMFSWVLSYVREGAFVARISPPSSCVSSSEGLFCMIVVPCSFVLLCCVLLVHSLLLLFHVAHLLDYLPV